MAEPLGSSLRPAPRSGLTSPEQVRTHDARQATRPQPPARGPDKPQNRQRQAKHALKALTNENAHHQFIRWIEAKAVPERAWLREVSAVVLQQALADLNRAYRNFFDSITGKRKGPRVGAASVQVA